ncbi:DISP1 protein, partial [Aphelenchoides avenae]
MSPVFQTVLGITFFPFINLLVIVIAMAVGADDAFVLTYQYHKAKKELNAMTSKILNTEFNLIPTFPKKVCSYEFADPYASAPWTCRDAIPNVGIHLALRHAAVAMFVTSATTSVAFMTNCVSNIVILRCFGLFAGITILFNYIFVITALPAALLLLERWKYQSPPAPPAFDVLSFRCFRRMLLKLHDFQIYVLPAIVYKLRYVLSLASVLLAVFGIYSVL